jgi:hypothetical protein
MGVARTLLSFAAGGVSRAGGAESAMSSERTGDGAGGAAGIAPKSSALPEAESGGRDAV